MSVVYVITTLIPKDGKNATMDQIRRKNKWENDDYVCRGLIFNGMSDPLFDIYQNIEFSKELRDSLEAKYMAEDASSKKFLAIGSNNIVGPSVVNMVDHDNSFRYNHNKGKCKHQDTKVDPNKKSKVTCWKCGKPRHLKNDCKCGKVGNNDNGSSTNDLVNGSSNSLEGQNMFNKYFQVYYVTYVSKAYFMQDDDVAWWVQEQLCMCVKHLLDYTSCSSPPLVGPLECDIRFIKLN
ncbi:zinc finger, CCHC-type containing protein [Tanacetum coccineum]